MLSTALIVFREVLEAALILGIVLTATRGVIGRAHPIFAGLAAGVVGACLVALSADKLAQLAEGVGPELLNASVLLAATVMIAWHNLWMAQHGRELATNIKSMGRDVSSGSRPVHMLAIVVALAVLREGSEVVLFLYGIAASGATGGELLAGALLGLAAGLGIGGALYLGLLRIPTRHLFSVTTALLVLLAAGMAAQAGAYLIQAGVLPAIKPVLWDSSAILPEHSLIGQMLHTLVGYVDRPSGMQLLVYLATVTVIGGLTLASRKPGALKPVGATMVVVAAAMALLVLFVPSVAHAGHKVYYPTVELGETEVEFRGHADFDRNPTRDNAQVYKIGVGHGFTDYWFSEVYAEIARPAGSSSYDVAAYEWENIFRLTDPGKYWADFGFIVSYEQARESNEPNKWELTPIVQKQIGRQLVTLNVVFERETGNNAEKVWDLEYAWQYRRLGNPALEYGLEGYGHVGKATHWDPSSEQRHQVGPAIFGKVKPGIGRGLKYQLGLLFGLTGITPQKTLYANLEFEF